LGGSQKAKDAGSDATQTNENERTLDNLFFHNLQIQSFRTDNEFCLNRRTQRRNHLRLQLRAVDPPSLPQVAETQIDQNVPSRQELF
jgi:hypothetical protein